MLIAMKWTLLTFHMYDWEKTLFFIWFGLFGSEIWREEKSQQSTWSKSHFLPVPAIEMRKDLPTLPIYKLKTENKNNIFLLFPRVPMHDKRFWRWPGWPSEKELFIQEVASTYSHPSSVGVWLHTSHLNIQGYMSHVFFPRRVNHNTTEGFKLLIWIWVCGLLIASFSSGTEQDSQGGIRESQLIS